MPKANNITLAQYLPIEALNEVTSNVQLYQVQLWIKRERFSKLGDFRPQKNGIPARISINGNLNSYSFLLVFLHELAHAVVFQKHGNALAPHGKAWKDAYGFLLRDFASKGCFHNTLIEAIISYSFRVKGSGIGCLELQRLLRMFDGNLNTDDSSFLEDLPENSLFISKSGRLFRKEQKLRKRFRCFCLNQKRTYLFRPMAVVKIYDSNIQKKSVMNFSSQLEAASSFVN